MDIKREVLDELCKLDLKLDIKKYRDLFVFSSDSKNGDVCLPCFTLAKELKTSPLKIAQDLASNINSNLLDNGVILKSEAVNGYLNIFVVKSLIVKNVLKEIFEKKQSFGSSGEFEGKTVVLDYSSVNLAKYMHIGHLKTTIIGLVLKNVYQNLGYKTISINYVGDYGTPFGKMIVAYNKWGNKQDVESRGVDAIQDLYVKFNQEAEKDESLNEEARFWFKKIESGDKKAKELSSYIIELCRGEVERLCNELGVKFDSWRGEGYYSNKMQPVIDELSRKGLLKESQGAKVVDLSEYGLGVCLIQKSDGTSLYATRDLAAVQDRYDNYKFDKALYITDIAQKLHFAQWFKICELLEKPYANNLFHISYGRYSLPTGKISSRLGKQALLKDLISAGIEKSKEIMLQRGTKGNDCDEISKKVAIGAISFEAIKNEKIKDTIFDIDASLNFDGETSPYMQYTYARCCSILEKAGKKIDIDKINFENIDNMNGYEIVKLLNKFPQTIFDVYEKSEPCLLVRLLMDISSEFNKFYTNNRIIDNQKVNMQNLSIVNAVKIVLENGFQLVNIPAIKKM